MDDHSLTHSRYSFVSHSLAEPLKRLETNSIELTVYGFHHISFLNNQTSFGFAGDSHTPTYNFTIRGVVGLNHHLIFDFVWIFHFWHFDHLILKNEKILDEGNVKCNYFFFNKITSIR